MAGILVVIVKFGVTNFILNILSVLFSWLYNFITAKAVGEPVKPKPDLIREVP